MSHSLDRVARGDLCTGCGACALAAPDAITMQVTPPGYLRPALSGPLTAAQDARIATTCPGLTLTQETRGPHSDAVWGPYHTARTGHATDPDLRYHASSGGGVSALLTHALATGQIDAVIQTGADPDRPVGTCPTISVTAADISAAAGSRYAPSAPLATLGPILDDTTRRFAFVGKPCDVTALRAVARMDPRVDQRIPLMLSFFCAGVPSLAGADKVVERLGFAPEDITAFQYRGDGWPGFAKATHKDGRTAQMSYHDSWGKILSSHVQHRCKICPDGTGGAADVVCADIWDCDADGYPLFDEADGISLILSRSETGEDLVRAAQAAGRIETQPFEMDRLGPIQPGQYNRKRYLVARLAALRLLGRPTPKMAGYTLWAAARKGRLMAHLRNFAGTLKRALRR